MCRARNADRRAAAEPDHVRIACPIGCWHDDFVAGFERCQESIEDHLLGTTPHSNLAVGVDESAITSNCLPGGIAQSRDSIGWRIAERTAGGVNGGIRYMRRRSEIGLAEGEIDDVSTG
ncbi:hypothetical protein D9M68_845030 [compost metagenome]